MTTSTSAWVESQVEVAGVTVPLLRRGRGDPLLVLPHDTGTPSVAAFHDSLADRFDVIVPTLPGYDGSQRAEWMRSVRDMAVLMNFFATQLATQLGTERLGLVGHGFGGWIAAEMATMDPRRFSHLVLVGAAGLLPSAGEILDQFLLGHEDFVRAGFHSEDAFSAYYDGQPSVEQLITWDANREMTARIAWKPYMYSQTLSMLLAEVRLPALVVWGAENRVVPIACAHQYVEALPDARLDVIPDAGHFIEIEQPQALASAIIGFMGR